MMESQIEMQNIGRLQQQLLPQTLPQFAGWDFAVHHEVGSSGGDYYDLLPMGTNHLAVLVEDVSGHGPAAAMLTAMIRMLLHSYPITSGRRRDPFCSVESNCLRSPDVLAHLNQVLLENSLEDQFTTMVLGIVDLVKGEIQFSLAGHMAPCWWQAGHAVFPVLPDIAGLPLGVDAEACYKSATIQMSSGDVVVFYTDGLAEAQNQAGKMFGRVRLELALRGSAGGTAEVIKNATLLALHEFANGIGFHDDVTILVIKKVLSRESSMSELFIG